MSDKARIEAVLQYWFGDPPFQPRGDVWFTGGKKVDEEIRQQFGHEVEAALAGQLDGWAESAQGALALVILLDQFTRNLYRGTAQAFSGDDRALSVCLESLKRGDAERLHPMQASFLLMPLEHSESMEMQDRCVAHFEALAERAPADLQVYLSGNVDYANKHREIVQRFGRFPHRNDVLGRQPTPEETEYLNSGGARFGQ